MWRRAERVAHCWGGVGERGCNIVGGREIDYDSGKREERVGEVGREGRWNM